MSNRLIKGLLDNFTITVNSIDKLLLVDHELYPNVIVLGYYDGNLNGGGTFKWVPETIRTSHNGGTIISPTVPWDGVAGATQAAFLAGTGETDSGGSGCWERVVDGTLSIREFGALLNFSDDSAPLQSYINFVQPFSEVRNEQGSELGLGGQILINKPLTFINYGKIIAIGEPAVAGTELLKIASDNVTFDNQGEMDWQDSKWSGVSAQATTVPLRNINCWMGNFHNTNLDLDGSFHYALSYASVIGGTVDLSDVHDVGGYGFYSQFCQGLRTRNNIKVKRASYAGINCSANLDCVFAGIDVSEIGYFGVKRGFGQAGVISGDITPTASAFSVTKDIGAVLAWKVGQHFYSIYNNATCVDGVVISITDNGTYLTIGTALPMELTPLVGSALQIVDNTITVEAKVMWTGDNGFDCNIVGGHGKDIAPTVRFAGLYTEMGDHRMLGDGVWVGADPQGANTGFRINNYTLIDPIIEFCAGSGHEVFGIGRNVWCRGGQVNWCNMLNEPLGTLDPSYGCISMNRLSYGIGVNFGVDGTSCETKNGYTMLLGYSLDAQINNLSGSGPVGIVLQEIVGRCEINNPKIVTSLAGSSALKIRSTAGQAPGGIKVLGGSLTANGAGSVAYNNASTNASDLFLSKTTSLNVEGSGTKISNSTANLTFQQEYDNSIPDSKTAGSASDGLLFIKKGSVAASAVVELGSVYADNGTCGAILVRGTAWTSGGKHTFEVSAQGDTNALSVSFSTIGTSPTTPFLVSGDFTATANANGFTLTYTNNEAGTVRYICEVLELSRF